MAVVIATIKDRITTVPDDVELVCNNPTDEIEVDFDDEWSGKTGYVARFEWNGKYYDVPFTGNRVQVPEISNTAWIVFGVYSDDITAAPVKIKCKKSILCYGDHVRQPPANPFYEEFCERLEALEKAGAFVGIAEYLPVASENYRGKFLIVSQGYTDKLYICLRNDGRFEWVEFGGAQTPDIEIDTDTAELGKAILGQMRLA